MAMVSHLDSRFARPLISICSAAAAAVALTISPAESFAGGFEIPENGTIALGRGGAHIAGVNDASAVYFNPAALTRVNRTSIVLDANLIDMDISFERSPYVYYDGEENESNRREIRYEKVENELNFFPAPLIFGAYRFKDKPWVLGAGVYGPSAYGAGKYPEMEIRPRNYTGQISGVYVPGRNLISTPENESIIERDGGQAYMITQRSVLLVFPSLSFAYRIEKANLSLGVTAQAALVFVDFDLGMDGGGTETAYTPVVEDDALYTAVGMKVSGVGATGIIGALWDPHPRVSLALTYRPRFNLRSKGDVDIEFPRELEGANLQISNTNAVLKIKMPDVLKFGVLYRGLAGDFETFNVELNANYEMWSRTEGFDVDVEGRVSSESGTLADPRPIPHVFLPRFYKNTLSLRLGSDLRFLVNRETGNGPTFRLGAFWESNGVDEEWTNLDFIPFMKVGGTVGFSYQIQRFSIDTAFSYLWMPERKVDNGKFPIILPLWICEDTGSPNYPTDACSGLDTSDVTHAVNDGKYKASAKTLSLGFTYRY